MDGKKYEQRVAYYLRRKGYKRVKVTKASNDYGVDVIAYKHREKYAVQCKYYAKPVGVHAVQQVVGGMKYYDCDRAMVVTNSTYTRQAIELAARNDVVLIEGMKGRFSFRKAYMRVILFLILADLLFTRFWYIGAVGLLAFLCFGLFGIYVRNKYRREVDEALEEDEELDD